MNLHQIVVAADRLTRFLTDLFAAAGMPTTDAAFSAGCMTRTNLWGVDSHGTLRAPIYAERLSSGAVNPRPKISRIAGTEATAIEVLDGDAGLGYVVARDAMARTIDKARRMGCGTVLVRNSNHFGAAALFARTAAEHGMIGVVATNVMPNIGVKGNAKPSTGNNPIAMAAPLFSEFPFCLDISMSTVSGGKLLLAAKIGRKIPTDWAVTADGAETDDPEEGFKGFLLPLGMHKGFGLSLFIDIIAGVASGGAFSRQIRSMYKHREHPSLTCHWFYALDPALLMPGEEFGKRMQEWAAEIRATPMVEAGQQQLIPGEIEHRTEQERRARGIPFSVELIDELRSTADRLGVSFSLTDA